MTPEELQAIRERANNATPGPWEASEAVDETEFGSYVAYGVAPIAPLEWYSDSDAAHTALDVMDKADAEFIAHARTDIPDLLDLVAKLEQRVRARDITIQTLSSIHANRVEAVRELHRPYTAGDGKQYCESCVEAFPWGGESIAHPCPTIQALDGSAE